MAITQLPAVNAGLNATSVVLLAAGYVCIRRRARRAHAALMLSALVVSAVFLCCYLYYHSHVRMVTRFQGEGFICPVYFAILLSHTVLAIVAAVWLVPVTVWWAARGRFYKHRAVARWTLPVWFYVSVTGVLIYFMLYHWYAHS